MQTIINLFQSGLSAIIPFVILLGVLIFVHEMGHFIVARWCGVRVEVFSMGFGKKIFQFKRGDTTYAISLIPLGGYVKMFGEQPGDDIAAADKAVSFTHKTVWQRIAIVSAGPLMNFLFAILVFALVGLVGEEKRAPIVGSVNPQSYAEKIGLAAGDEIIKVESEKISTWDDFQLALNHHRNQTTAITFKSHKDNSEKTVQAQVSVKANPNIISTDDTVGDIEGLSYMSKGTAIALTDNSPLKNLGIKNGDNIVAVNGKKTESWHALEKVLTNAPATEALQIDVERIAGEEGSQPLSVTLNSQEGRVHSLESIGVISAETFLGKITPDSPAAKADLQVGDRLTAINGTPIQVWEDVLNTVRSYDGKDALLFEVQRNDEKLIKKITPQLTSLPNAVGIEEQKYAIGIQPFLSFGRVETVTVKSANSMTAIGDGITRTIDVSKMTVMSFVRLFQAKVSPKNIGGVIAIGQAARDTFKMGISQFLTMMGIISVNLFILNLLPVPVLDGGHLVFYAIEVIKGSPLSLKKMEVAQRIGIILLMSLMVFALFNDFSRLFRS